MTEQSFDSGVSNTGDEGWVTVEWDSTLLLLASPVGHQPLHSPEEAVHGLASCCRRDVLVAAARLRHSRQWHCWCGVGAPDHGPVIWVNCAVGQLSQCALVCAVPCRDNVMRRYC